MIFLSLPRWEDRSRWTASSQPWPTYAAGQPWRQSTRQGIDQGQYRGQDAASILHQFGPARTEKRLACIKGKTCVGCGWWLYGWLSLNWLSVQMDWWSVVVRVWWMTFLLVHTRSENFKVTVEIVKQYMLDVFVNLGRWKWTFNERSSVFGVD